MYRSWFEFFLVQNFANPLLQIMVMNLKCAYRQCVSMAHWLKHVLMLYKLELTGRFIFFNLTVGCSASVVHREIEVVNVHLTYVLHTTVMSVIIILMSCMR